MPDVAIAVGAFVFVVLAVSVALARIGHSFELEWMGGAMVDHTCRVIDGEPLYAAPTAEHVPFLYAPLQFWLSATMATLTGEGFLPMRLVSLLSSLAIAALLWSLVRRRTARAMPAVAAVMVFAGGYFVVDTWYDTTRADALMVCLSLVAVTLLERGVGARSAIAAGVVMVAAYFAKQTAFVFVVPFALFVATTSARRAGSFLLSFAAAWLLACGAMHLATDGWFTFYTWTMPRRHGLEWGPAWNFWWLDLRSFWPVLVVIAWLIVERVRGGQLRSAVRDGALVAGLVGASLLSRMHDGGALNVVIPAVAGLALLAGIALGDARQRTGSFARAVPWLLLVQTAMLGFDWGDADARHGPRPIEPFRWVPSTEDTIVGESVAAALREAEGEVLVPRHGYLPRMAGKRGGAHEMAIIDLKRSGEPELAERVLGAMYDAVTSGAVSLILVDEHVETSAWPGYTADEPIVPPRSTAFLPVIGLPTRPVVPLRRLP